MYIYNLHHYSYKGTCLVMQMQHQTASVEHMMISTVTCGDSSSHHPVHTRAQSPAAGGGGGGGDSAKQTWQKQGSHKKESGAEYLVNIQHWSPGRVLMLASVFIYTFIRFYDVTAQIFSTVHCDSAVATT